MSTSTYPKEWKNKFIFVSPSMLSEPLPIRDLAAVIEDGVPPLSATEDVLWRRMYEHSTRAFNFPEGILATGGLSPFYPTRPKALYESIGKGVSYVVEGVVNQEMGGVLGGGAPNVEGSNVELVLGEGTPSLDGGFPQGIRGFTELYPNGEC
ncbi:hypothetical protein HanIR_Chr14g0673921 [Helianthus annuus]|nr:hypothetical protein HanIR_Chr14g0673921 [Helianthus annuus]